MGAAFSFEIVDSQIKRLKKRCEAALRQTRSATQAGLTPGKGDDEGLHKADRKEMKWALSMRGARNFRLLQHLDGQQREVCAVGVQREAVRNAVEAAALALQHGGNRG